MFPPRRRRGTAVGVGAGAHPERASTALHIERRVLDRIRFDIHRLPRGGPWIHAQNGVTRAGGVTTFASLRQRVDVSIRARSRRSGRRAAEAVQGRIRHVSIRARSRRSGRPAIRDISVHGLNVSIRARSRRSGRHPEGPRAMQLQVVSIRARSRRSGRLVGEGAGIWRINVSIRARSRRSGRPQLRARVVRGGRGFNSRPLP